MVVDVVVAVPPAAAGRESVAVAVGADDAAVVGRLVVALALTRHRERREPRLFALDVGAPVLVDHPLDPLADLLRFGADGRRALPCSDGILDRNGPRALGRRAPHRVVGEEDAAVAQPLLDDLGGGCGDVLRRGGDE